MSAEPRLSKKLFSSSEHYDAYLNLRTSLFHFNRLPSELEQEADRAKLADEVIKQRAINQAVQFSPEYAQMVVTEQERDQAIQEIYQQIPAETNLDALLLQNGLTHASLREAIELANAAASVVIHQLGTTGTASVRQIRAALD